MSVSAGCDLAVWCPVSQTHKARPWGSSSASSASPPNFQQRKVCTHTKGIEHFISRFLTSLRTVHSTHGAQAFWCKCDNNCFDVPRSGPGTRVDLPTNSPCFLWVKSRTSFPDQWKCKNQLILLVMIYPFNILRFLNMFWWSQKFSVHLLLSFQDLDSLMSFATPRFSWKPSKTNFKANTSTTKRTTIL